MPRRAYESQHEDFRAVARTFIQRVVLPYYQKWEDDGIIPATSTSPLAGRGGSGWRFPRGSAAGASTTSGSTL